MNESGLFLSILCLAVFFTITAPAAADLPLAEDATTAAERFPPIAYPGYWPVDGFPPLTVKCEDRSSFGPTSWLWDFGDGATSTEQHPVHTYTEPGSYLINLTVSNALGSDSRNGYNLVTVRDPANPGRPPEADFSFEWNLNGVQFRDSSGWCPTGWHWDFGDGAASTEQHPVHLYTVPGTYTATLTAENVCGTGTASTPITLVSLELRIAHPFIAPGETTAADIVMHTAPAGLAGYDLALTLEESGPAMFTAVEYPSWGTLHTNGSLPAPTLYLKAVDLRDAVAPGAEETILATVAIRGVEAGTTNINVTAAHIDDDDGSPVLPRVLPARIGVRPLLAVPSAALPPQDLDGDGRCEDINGNGRADFDDVVVFYRSMGWIADNEPTGAFDYNENGRIDFQDLVLLYRPV